MGRNVVFRTEILNHGISAALAKAVVIIRWADRIRTAFDRDDVSLGVRNHGCHLVELVLSLFCQEIPVEAEMDRPELVAIDVVAKERDAFLPIRQG